MEATHAGAVHEERQPTGRSHAGEVHGGLSPMLEQGKSVRSPSPEDEGAAETMCGELTASPIACLLHHLGGGVREYWK